MNIMKNFFTDDWKKELFTIPNMMSFFRLILIPVFAWIYLCADTATDYYIAAGVLVVSTLTDFLDGQIARRFNMISKFGIALDPFADKLTHAVVMVCLATTYPIMWLLFGLSFIKEGFMFVMGTIFLRKGKMLSGAKWFGKVCTALLFFALVALVAVPAIPELYVNLIVGICAAMMIFTLLMYIPVFAKMKQEPAN